MLKLLTTRSPSSARVSVKAYSDVGITPVYSEFRAQEKKYRIKTFIADFKKIQPDIFWFLKDEWLKPPLLKTLKRVSPKTKFIMWYGDQRGKVPEVIGSRSKFIDMLLVNNADPQQVKMYKKAGISHVKPFYPIYYPTEFNNIKPNIDVIFGGNNFRPQKFPLSKFRLQTVLAINKICNMKVYGRGWPVPAEKYITDRTAYNQALHRAKITLGVNHYHIVRYYDRRLFDCLSTGRLHLTHYIPGMEKDFNNHKDLVWFKTVAQAVKLTKYYLKHDKEREQIGKAGLAKLLKEHSMEARIRQFAKNISILF
jgi:hypothetical protein